MMRHSQPPAHIRVQDVAGERRERMRDEQRSAVGGAAVESRARDSHKTPVIAEHNRTLLILPLKARRSMRASGRRPNWRSAGDAGTMRTKQKPVLRLPESIKYRTT